MEKHRIEQAKWRIKNREAALAISRRAYNKHREEYNAIRKEKYRTDPDYKKKKIEQEKRYNATGRRKELRVKDAVVLRKRASMWKKENKEWVKQYVRKYKDRYWIEHERQQRKNLDDPYVIRVIKKSVDYQLKTKDIPKDLIEIYRTKIIIHRLLKQLL